MPGVRARVQGKTKRRGPGLQMANPQWEVLRPDDEEPPEHESRMKPIYPANEELKPWLIAKIMAVAAPQALPLIDDHLPEEYRRERHLPELREAYRMQHFAADERRRRSRGGGWRTTNCSCCNWACI